MDSSGEAAPVWPPDALDGAPSPATITVDKAGVVTGWSPGATALLGRLPQEMLGRPLTDAVTPRDGVLSALTDGCRGALSIRRPERASEPLAVEAHMLHRQAQGDEWLLTMTSGGHPRSAGITDRSLLEWIFTASPIALTVYDRQLRCLRQNTAMSRLTGTRETDRQGRGPESVLSGAGIDGYRRQLCQVLKTDRSIASFTLQGRTPVDPDHDHVFSVTASPLHDARGEVAGVCVTAQDVTPEQRHRQRLAMLNEASAHIGSTLDLSETARELTQVVVPRLADFVSVDLLEPLLRGDEPGPATDGAELRRIAHLSLRQGTPEAVVPLGAVDYFPGHSPPARCLATGRPVLLRSMDPTAQRWFADDPRRALKTTQYGFHSWMFLPVQARGVCMGVTVFCRSWPAEPFEQEDIDLAEELVTRAAISLDNARLYTRERTTALALQSSLLPGRFPPQPALSVVGRYLPAMSQYGVGGDWFDVIPLSGARVALVVGDVVGHGLHASATMGRLRTAVRTLADVDLPPDELLMHLDDLVTRLGTEESAENGLNMGMWATVLYAVYDPVSGTVSCASAGHPPPGTLTPAGDARFLDVTPGPPLGLGGLQFEVGEFEVHEGSDIVLYTDGLVGHRELPVHEGMERLLQILRRPAESLERRCDAVLADLLPVNPEDDAALLLARTRTLGSDRVAVLEIPQEPEFVARARSWATGQLAEWGCESADFVTELVVSELVTNAIRYGVQPVRLRLIKGESLICEVGDGSSTSPHLRKAQVFDEGGRGLLLVAQVTDRWGTRHHRTGKTVWCEQKLPEESPTRPLKDGTVESGS